MMIPSKLDTGMFYQRVQVIVGTEIHTGLEPERLDVETLTVDRMVEKFDPPFIVLNST